MIATETLRNLSPSARSDARTAWAAMVGIGLLFAFLVTLLLITRPVAPPTPAPSPVVVDSGFHAAMNQDGSLYMIDQPYVAMNDAQRDAANRFAHTFPNGLSV